MGYTGDKKREYQREWVKRRRARAVEYLGGRCVVCGIVGELEIDHKDRTTKKFNPGTIWGRRWEVQNEELDKCQLLCEKHHLEKTIKEMDRSPHGTHNRYTTGCRCDPCRLAHNKSTTEWKRKQKKNNGALTSEALEPS